MKRYPLIVMAVLLVGVSTAQAQDDTTTTGEYSGEASGEVTSSGEVAATTTAVPAGANTLGIGSVLTLGGAVGLDVVFHLQEQIFIEGIIGFTNTSPDEGDGATALTLGAGGHYKLHEKGPANLYIGGRITFSDDGVDGGASSTTFEFPLQVRLNVHEKLSFQFETGVGVTLRSQGEADFTDFFLGRGALYGLGGFTLYL